jgi:hypothetical protein
MDFPGADADASAVFRYQMSRLREALAGIDPAAVGLSDRSWSNVREMIMATRSYELVGRQPQPWELLKTSGLSDRQWKAARQSALRLRLVRAVRVYHGTARLQDSLAVAIEVILALSKSRPQGVCSPSAARLQPVPSSTVSPRAPAGAALELPILLPSSSSGAEPAAATATASVGGKQPEPTASVRESGTEEEEFFELVEKCRRLLPCPARIEAALRQARANGCTLDELRARCRWWQKHYGDWPAEHRRGAFYTSLVEARPGVPAAEGWPYAAGGAKR